MSGVEELATQCPYCGEPISLLVDGSEGDARYIEDCEVCCRPMNVRVLVRAGEASVQVGSDED